MFTAKFSFANVSAAFRTRRYVCVCPSRKYTWNRFTAKSHVMECSGRNDAASVVVYMRNFWYHSRDVQHEMAARVRSTRSIARRCHWLNRFSSDSFENSIRGMIC